MSRLSEALNKLRVKCSGHGKPQSDRIDDILECIGDHFGTIVNPDISFKEFVEGTLEEFKSDYVTEIPPSSFYNYTTLKTVELSAVTKIGKSAFYGCTALERVVISAPKMCVLVNEIAFKNTPIENGAGYIYVPANLLTEYKADSVWGTFAEQFKTFGETESLLSDNEVEIYDTESTFVRDRAFSSNQNLKKIVMTKATEIGKQAFSQLPLLETVEFPELLEIKNNAFLQCNNVKNMSFPKLQTLGSSSVFQMAGLEVFEAPNVVTIGSTAFNGCKALKALSFPLITTVTGDAFSGMTGLENVNLPNLTTLSVRAFRNCLKLQKVDFPKVTNIQRDVFYNCETLSVLALRSETLCVLEDKSAFNSTPFAEGGTGGVVLVPSALVESYKTATNWATLYGYGTCEFLPLEEYTVDGTTTGEIDWDKLNSRETTTTE